MENLPLLIPLVVLIPAVGALVNFFWGKWLDESWSALVGVGAAVLAFLVSLLIFVAYNAGHGQTFIVNPPFLSDWIRIDSVALVIPWQQRVDGLSVAMLLVVTGVGSLIHIYSKGYMHGDPKYSRFFAYLNMFLAFMLILVTANNFAMLFVGWEGVGLCSFLLIGFWWDKPMPLGLKNTRAAIKAFVVNRIGDFGVLMAMFLIFWTFGTLDFYRPTEVTNVPLAQEQLEKAETTTEEAVVLETTADESHGTAVTHYDNHHITDENGYNSLGVFNQALALTQLKEGETLTYYDAAGNVYEKGRDIKIGPLTLDIADVIALIMIFLLLGATGKSAQIPLFVWLPDAMAGPTPVSALMHAATMVTGGVFLLLRVNVLIDLSPLWVTFAIATVGAVTALVAGFMGIGQWDIKRVLAYSTISQLGFMIAAIGVGGYVAAMFHLITHAVFKALLFLGSGSVIHGVEHGHHHANHDHHGDEHADNFDPQDMRNMGGLRHRMPITFWTYVIGTLALSGIPIFAGFWSKDEILSHALYNGLYQGELGGYLAFALLLIAAFFTAFYMWRQVSLVFLGSPRSEAAAHAPESVPSMTIPLVVLAFFSIVIGFINIPSGMFLADIYPAHQFGHFLESIMPSITEHAALDFNLALALIATGFGLAGLALAHSMYAGDKGVVDGDKDTMQKTPLADAWAFSNARMYWDDTYGVLFVRPFNRLADFFAEQLDWNFLHDYLHDSILKRGFDAVANALANPIDLGIIDGAVNGIGWLIRQFSGLLRGLQTGYVRTYAVALLIGVVAVLLVLLLPLIRLAL